MTNFIDKLQLRRRNEIKKIEKEILESFVRADYSHSVYPKNYEEMDKYLEYFQESTPLLSIIKNVKKYEAPVHFDNAIPFCYPSRQHFIITFKDYELDLKTIKDEAKEIKEVEVKKESRFKRLCTRAYNMTKETR
jgi:hypothetical protein